MKEIHEIFRDIESNDLPAVQKYLLEMPKTNQCNETQNFKGSTLFSWAIACRKIEMATMIREALIKRKDPIGCIADEKKYYLAIREKNTKTMIDAIAKNNIKAVKKAILNIPLSEKLNRISGWTLASRAFFYGRAYEDATITEVVLEALRLRGEKCIPENNKDRLCIFEFAIFQDIDAKEVRSNTNLLKTILSMGCLPGLNENPAFIKVIKAGAIAHAELLLQYKVNTNPKIGGEGHLVQLAIDSKHYDMAALLIRYGAYFSKKQLKILQSKYGIEKTQCSIDAAVSGFKKKTITLESILQLPTEVLGCMDENQLTDIVNKLIIIINSKNINISKKTRELVSNFLRSHEKLAFRSLSRIKVVAELWKMVTAPESIDQKQSALCGPASLLSLMADSFPEKLIEVGLALASTGKVIAGSALIHSSKKSRKKERSIMDALLIAMQQSRSLTTPKTLTIWFEQLGFEDVTESMLVKGRTLGCGKIVDANQVSKITQWMFSIYSKKHRSLPGAHDLEELEKKMGAGAKAIIKLDLAYCLTGMGYPVKGLVSNHGAGFLGTHYVYLHALKIDPNKEKITLCYSTYGAKVEKECALKDFLKNYHGAIVGSISMKKLTESPKLT